jgi:AcrR family transcriptional regulator
MTIVQEHIADSFIGLLKTHSYSGITIQMICDNTPASRNTFYYYFRNKEKLVEWICFQDYAKYCFPYFQIKVDNIRTKSMFLCILKNKVFYTALSAVDGGHLLRDCLIKVYSSGLSEENVNKYVQIAQNSQPQVDFEFFRRYLSAGTVAIIMSWIEGGMTIPVDNLVRDIALIFSKSPDEILTNYLF